MRFRFSTDEHLHVAHPQLKNRAALSQDFVGTEHFTELLLSERATAWVQENLAGGSALRTITIGPGIERTLMTVTVRSPRSWLGDDATATLRFEGFYKVHGFRAAPDDWTPEVFFLPSVESGVDRQIWLPTSLADKLRASQLTGWTLTAETDNYWIVPEEHLPLVAPGVPIVSST